MIMRRALTGFLIRLIFVVIGVLLPFWAMVRMALIAVIEWSWSPWLAMLLGVTVSAFMLWIYSIALFSTVFKSIPGPKFFTRTFWGMLVVCLCYTLPATLFLSAEHAKHDEVQTEFRDLHPILRLSVSSMAIFDAGMIVTDASRNLSDYADMGLKENSYSQHLIQDDGYAHAIDIRTHGRSEVINFFVRWSFEGMGFETLRHTGTEDHLHIGMPK